ncbi:hypothetical protein Gekk315_00068 [Aeromonas phage Gekk3-15]
MATFKLTHVYEKGNRSRLTSSLLTINGKSYGFHKGLHGSTIKRLLEMSNVEAGEYFKGYGSADVNCWPHTLYGGKVKMSVIYRGK